MGVQKPSTAAADADNTPDVHATDAPIKPEKSSMNSADAFEQPETKTVDAAENGDGKAVEEVIQKDVIDVDAKGAKTKPDKDAGAQGKADEEKEEAHGDDVEEVIEEIEEDEDDEDEDDEEEFTPSGDDGEEDDDDNDDDVEGESPAAKMGLSKEVVTRFLSKSNITVRALHEAAKVDDVDTITKLLDAETEPKLDVNASDAFEYTALHVASETGSTGAAEKLIAAGASLELPTRMHQCRPLHYAAGEGHEKVVKILVDAGADINSVTDDGRTALLQAALRGQVESVRVLLQLKADATIMNDEGKTPADVAEKREILDLLEAPAEKKARIE